MKPAEEIWPGLLIVCLDRISMWGYGSWMGGEVGEEGSEVRNRRLYISTFEALLSLLGVAGRDNDFLKLFTWGK